MLSELGNKQLANRACGSILYNNRVKRLGGKCDASPLPLLALIDLAVGAVDIAAQLAPLVCGKPAFAALVALGRLFGTAKIPMRRALHAVWALPLRLCTKPLAAELAP